MNRTSTQTSAVVSSTAFLETMLKNLPSRKKVVLLLRGLEGPIGHDEEVCSNFQDADLKIPGLTTAGTKEKVTLIGC